MKEKALEIFAWILYGIYYFLGKITVFIIGYLGQIASYNHFIDAPAVERGWSMVLGLANMFFILILLVIAFGTILQIESYNAKRLLPKLIIMAILINFSKTICGLIIDFSQVIMLTFVHGFINQGSNTLVDLLGLQKAVGMTKDSWHITDISLETIAAILLAIITMLVVLVVITVILVILVFRVIMLWVYVILSPLAYLLSAFPQGQKYASMWWSEFTQNVVSGPVIAFFVWLALKSAGSSAGMLANENNLPVGVEKGIISQILQAQTFQTYVITISMLVGGLMVSMKLGGVAGKVAGNGMAKLRSGGDWSRRKIVGGIGRRTGLTYARDVGKSYLAQRKSARDDKHQQRVDAGASVVAAGVGGAKRLVSYPLRSVGSKVNARWNKDLTKAEKSIEDNKNKKAEILDNIKNENDFKTEDGAKYKYSDGKWNVEEKNGESRTVDSHKLMSELEEKYDKKISTDQAEADRLKKINQRNSKFAKAGLLVTGAAVGAAVAGPLGVVTTSLGAIAGAIGGGKLVPDAATGIKDAGKADYKLVENYKNQAVSDYREKIKNKDDKAVLATMNDQTKNKFERSAATMEAMSRKLMTLPEAISKRDKVKSEMKNDKGIMGKMESILEKNYAGATTTFDDLAGTDATKRTTADRVVRERFADGTYNLKDMDSKSLHAARVQMSQGMSTGKFVKEFKDVDSAKQATIINALKSTNTPEAKEKLAHITDIKTAFGSDKASAQKFTQSLSQEQITNILDKGTDAQVEAFRSAVNKDKNNLSKTMQRKFTGNSPIAKSIKDQLGIKDESKV